MRLFCALVHAGYKNPRSKVSASQRKFAAMCAVRRYAGAGCHSSWRANPFGFAAGCRRAGTACSKFRATKRCGPLCGKLPIFGIFPLFCAFLAECTLRKFPKYGIIYLQRRRENSDGKAGKSYARDYSGPLAHPGRSLAQLDRASAHSTRSAVQPMLAADQHTC